jgi:hypothetical protein
MKLHDALTGIHQRAAGRHPLSPTSFDIPPPDSGTYTFNFVSQSLYEEFPFLRSDNENMKDSELEQFNGLFAWLVEQLRTFSEPLTSTERSLTNILALAAMLECNNLVWDELAKAVPKISKPLLLALAKRIKETKINGKHVLMGLSCSTSRAQTILADVASKNWRSVEWILNHLSMRIWSPDKQHASAALYRFDRPRLESILEEERDFFEIAAYVLHAPTIQSLQLAIVSKNWTLKFWTLYRSVRCAAAGSESYPIEWQLLLSEAAKVPDEWARWLAVLNEFPGRYPQLQQALGNTLACATSEALDTYVSSIQDSSDFGRAEIATALSVFRKGAALRDRQRLWSAGFKKWEEWDFGCTKYAKSILRVEKSALDFLVIGYLTECLDSKERAKLFAKIQGRALDIERNWYSDITPAMSERYKLISTYQLLAHSEAIVAGELEWLWGPILYKPIWEDGSPYRNLKYDNPSAKPTFISN